MDRRKILAFAVSALGIGSAAAKPRRPAISKNSTRCEVSELAKAEAPQLLRPTPVPLPDENQRDQQSDHSHRRAAPVEK